VVEFTIGHITPFDTSSVSWIFLVNAGYILLSLPGFWREGLSFFMLRRKRLYFLSSLRHMAGLRRTEIKVMLDQGGNQL